MGSFLPDLFDLPEPADFARELEKELVQVLDWWPEHLWDQEEKAWYGRMKGDGTLDPDHSRGVILYTRLLWTYSSAARIMNNSYYRQLADHTYRYIRRYFQDTEQGGLIWEVSAKGEVLADKKQIYAQAFGIYAYSEYYRLTGSLEALESALEWCHLVEVHSFDPDHGGYYEAFDREWNLLSDMRLSEKDANTAKTMNTHLHLLEAFTNLYRVAPSESLNNQLTKLIRLFLDIFIDPVEQRLILFFDTTWDRQEDLISYGHDIETSWLLLEAADALADPDLLVEAKSAALHLVEAVIGHGVAPQGGLWYERKGDQLDEDRHWWPQIEAVVGFINAWQLVGNPYYYLLAYRTWEYIKNHLIDHEHGEWFWSVDKHGIPNIKDDKAGPWKANYHNCRGCMELMHRLMT
ncbi:MAG: AGE family epimerase/isomerase [Saprospiraceae bacterium]|nr:AGE family epimerase/isomerase [Saprospiraceae bacterium]